MNRRLIFIVVGVGLLVLLVAWIALAAFGGKKQQAAPKDTGPTVLRYWRVFDDTDKYQQQIDDYQAAHPNVQIEYRKLTFQEYERALIDALADGRGPDIFAVHNTWLPRYFDRISPVPEDTYKTVDYERDFYPPARETVKDGRIYGLPLSMDTIGMYVNDNIESDAAVEQTPATWEQLIGKDGNPNVLRQINRRQGDTFTRSAVALGDNNVSRGQDILALIMLQNRTKMTNDEHTQATFNLTQDVEGQQKPLGRIGLEFYTSFADPRTPNYSWNSRSGNSVRAFAQNKVGYFFGYAYHALEIDRLNPDLQYQIEKVPQIQGTSPVNYASFWAETVSKDSQHAEEAWKFIRYLTDTDSMYAYTEATRSVPARKDVSASGGLDALQEQLETARSWYKGDPEKADRIFARMVESVLRGERPQNAIDRGANDLTDVLRKLKEQES
ncbi:MAG TPA: extracellular solute-binding protein [Patescibacteria group bacterium]|jgi:ABC-type glycerol-3-phosphate transport system substrate-binding protein